MVEIKTVTVGLEEVAPPVGEPEFRFERYDILEAREVFPVQRTYKDGETVKVAYRVKNIGAGAGRWTITVKDMDTGAVITTWYGNLDPGYSFKTPTTGATVGRMPAKDWRLSVKVLP